MSGSAENAEWAVALQGVRKTYGKDIYALRGVDVRVGRGEIFGLLGPNGAGKSTLVKIMMTVVRPDHALGTVLGRPLGHRGKLRVVGYLPEGHRFPAYLTGGQLLAHYAALAKVPRARRKANAERLLEIVGMQSWADTRIGKYSKGMMQRLGLAQALMNDPELVVLDEPNANLDQPGEEALANVIGRLKSRGATSVLITHRLWILRRVDKILMLGADGCLFGPRDEILARLAGPRPGRETALDGEVINA